MYNIQISAGTISSEGEVQGLAEKSFNTLKKCFPNLRVWDQKYVANIVTSPIGCPDHIIIC